MSVDHVEFSIGGEAGIVLPWLPAAVILVSSDGMIAGHTPAATRMLADRNRSLTGEPLLQFFARGDDGVVAAFLQRVSRAAPDETIHADVRLARLDGAVRHVSTRRPGSGAERSGHPPTSAATLSAALDRSPRPWLAGLVAYPTTGTGHRADMAAVRVAAGLRLGLLLGVAAIGVMTRDGVNSGYRQAATRR